MIACKFSHSTSLIIEGEEWRIVGRDGMGGPIDKSGKLHCHAHAAVHLREAVCHVMLVDRAMILEINGERGIIVISSLGV